MNTVIKSLFAGSNEKELHEAIDTFCNKYTNFSHKNDHFESNKFIWKSKDISDGNSHLWHKNNPHHPPKFLGF